MYKIEKTAYGVKLVFADNIDAVEMQKWADESHRIVIFGGTKIGVVVDMRTLKPLAEAAQKIIVETQGWYQKSGMKRSAVLLATTTLTMQFRRLGRDSGIDKWERYIDVSKFPNYTAAEKAAVDWVSKEIDPGKVIA